MKMIICSLFLSLFPLSVHSSSCCAIISTTIHQPTPTYPSSYPTIHNSLHPPTFSMILSPMSPRSHPPTHPSIFSFNHSSYQAVSSPAIHPCIHKSTYVFTHPSWFHGLISYAWQLFAFLSSSYMFFYRVKEGFRKKIKYLICKGKTYQWKIWPILICIWPKMWVKVHIFYIWCIHIYLHMYT